MRKLLIWVLIIFSLTTPVKKYFEEKTADVINDNSIGKSYNYLLVGFDDAAENTDAIMLVRYNPEKHKAAVIQIPRDTYYNYGTKQNKINQIYPSNIALGKTKKESLAELSRVIENLFSIDICGFAGLTTDAFAGLVDSFGGIDIVLNNDIKLTDSNGSILMDLKKGTTHLTGEQAKTFVRFRKGYNLGDLSRMDAQKIFLSALFEKVKSGLGINTVINLFTSSKDGVVSSIKLNDILEILTKKSGRLSEIDVFYTTIPGESCVSANGISYFVCNKKSTNSLLLYLGFLNENFDSEERLCNYEEESFMNIYFKEKVVWKVYDKSTVRDIRPS